MEILYKHPEEDRVIFLNKNGYHVKYTKLARESGCNFFGLSVLPITYDVAKHYLTERGFYVHNK